LIEENFFDVLAIIQAGAKTCCRLGLALKTKQDAVDKFVGVMHLFDGGFSFPGPLRPKFS